MCGFRAAPPTTHTITTVHVAISSGIVFIWFRWGFCVITRPRYAAIAVWDATAAERYRGLARSGAELWLAGSRPRHRACAPAKVMRENTACVQAPCLHQLWPLQITQPPLRIKSPRCLNYQIYGTQCIVTDVWYTGMKNCPTFEVISCAGVGGCNRHAHCCHRLPHRAKRKSALNDNS